MKLLVTGGAGFIGSNFVRYVLRERPGWKLVNLDKLTYAGNLENLKDVEGNPNYRFVRGDISDRKLIDELFSEEGFDVVVNFAAETHVDRSILDPSPFLKTNVQGTQVLLEAARKYKVGRFLQISTDEVYGSVEEGAFTEESPLLPNSPYAASKASADLLCRAYHRTYGLPVVITRSSNNYGPYQFPEKLIPLMTLNALEERPLPVYGMGENIRDWLYVEDNCRAIALVLERGKEGEVYNIGGGEERRNIEVVERICELVAERTGRDEKKVKALITFVEDRPGHDFRYSLAWEKVRNLGWSPEVPFEIGLEMTIDWYMANMEWVERVRSGEYMRYYDEVYGPRGVGWKGRAKDIPSPPHGLHSKASSP